MSMGFFTFKAEIYLQMNIKEQIGQRIQSARKEKGLTQAELAKMSGELKQPRINNWERGIRTPGPQEIKQLASVLDVSPAFLMCLTDIKQVKKSAVVTLIPLLDHIQACEASVHIQAIQSHENLNNVIFIPVSLELMPQLGEFAFALKMLDDSMSPEIRINDVQVIDPSIVPKPSDYVAVKISGKPEAIICQYKKVSYTSPEFELLTLNDNWPNITVNESVQVEIIGKVTQNIREYV